MLDPRFTVILLVILYVILGVMMLLNSYYWAEPYDLAHLYNLNGIATGAILGYIFQEKKFPFAIEAARGKKYLRYIVGLAGTIGLLFGLKKILPENIISQMISYFVVGFWLFGLFPFVGIILGLFKNEKID